MTYSHYYVYLCELCVFVYPVASENATGGETFLVASMRVGSYFMSLAWTQMTPPTSLSLPSIFLPSIRAAKPHQPALGIA